MLLCLFFLLLFSSSMTVSHPEYVSTDLQDVKKPREVYCVTLAGGIGERLWPLSRQDRPKQFLPLIGKETLLEMTHRRFASVQGNKHYWAVTTAPLEQGVRTLLSGSLEHLVVEPARRNTAAALLLTCFTICERDSHAWVIFVPSDQYISDTSALVDALNSALDNQHTDHITLLGIKPSFPATGYGYIKSADPESHQRAAKVEGFYEKPSLEKAREYVAAGNMLWNAGIFCGPVRTFIDQFERYAPDIHTAVTQFMKGEIAYEAIPSTSIDYAVLEKSDSVSVVPVVFEWADIGNLSTLLTFRDRYNERVHEEVCVNCSNNLVHTGKKLVALVDVEGLCIADTEDVLLVMPCSSAERVKLAVEQLKANPTTTPYL